MNFFGKNLRFVCKSLAITQEELALKVKKTQTTIGNWQNEKTEPSIEELLVLCDFFGFDLDPFVKIDLQKSNLTKEEIVENFRLKGNLKSKLKGNLNHTSAPKNYESEATSSTLNDGDTTANWYLLKEMRIISQKLDQLQLSADQIKENITTDKKK